MQVVLLTIHSKKENWVVEAEEFYTKKLKAFFKFEIEKIRAAGGERASAEENKKREGEKLLSRIDKSDWVIALDEKGQTFENSRKFSQEFLKVIEKSPTRIVFVLGGAFGLSDAVKERAQKSWSLSPLTMSHWVAQTSFLEQLFRAMTLIKGLPYHND